MIIAKLGTLLASKASKYIVAGIAVLGLIGLVYWQGYKAASASCEADKRKALEELIEYQREIQEENEEINSAIIEDLQNKKEQTRIVYKKVIEYVESNPDRTDCELDADGLSLWNGDGSSKD